MDWLRVYQALPYPLQVVAASYRGAQLRRRRYDDRTPARVSEAHAREAWSPDQWAVWQAARLRPLLSLAATHVPYYRAHWRAHWRARGPGRGGDGTGPVHDLGRWPVLDKEAVRSDPASFVVNGVVDGVVDGRAGDAREALQTSGSTGTPLSLWRSEEAGRAWYGLWEARCRAWNGVGRDDRWAILGGRLVTPVARRTPPFWVWNQGLHQLYLSSYHLSPATTTHYLDALARHRVRYALGYPSALHALAVEVLSQGLHAPPVALVLTNAEPLLDYQRQTIGEAFRCPVVETYGMAEIVLAASECGAGRMHLWPDVGVLEVLRLDEDRPAAPGEVGRLVATGLLNDLMPLIRYDVGDVGAVEPGDRACACGRRLPVLSRLEGRRDDVVVTQDGRRIGRLDHVFTADLRIREAQVVQESIDELRVRLVVADGFGAAHADELRRRLRKRVGELAIRLDPVASIPRSANGKFRAILSRLPPGARATGLPVTPGSGAPPEA